MKTKDINPWKNFYRTQILEINKKKFTVKSYGLCKWRKVVFILDNGKEFYKLVRNITGASDKDTIRKEYFSGKLIRKYIGCQACFIEFLSQIQSGTKNILVIGENLGLTQEILDKYAKFYKNTFKKPMLK